LLHQKAIAATAAHGSGGPMSATRTLLRGTVRPAQDHELITDWHNPRIPSIRQVRPRRLHEHLITFLEQLGPRSHMVAICQPSVSALRPPHHVGGQSPARPRA